MSNPRSEDKEFDARAFRDVLGTFPTGVCVLTARTLLGEDLGFTISSFNSLSLDPPLVLFSISRTAHSLPKWERCEGFAINVLTHKQAHLSTKFATALSDKWKDVQFDRGLDGAPILADVAASLQCRPFARHDGGDHLLFIARVVRFSTEPKHLPLVHCMGKYYELENGSS